MQTSILRSLAIAAAITILTANSLSATEPTEPTTVTAPVPHCQVPCGIYTDQLRFEQMLEDTKTIAKSITSVETIAEAMKKGEQSPTNFNQMTRWINTKEDHDTSQLITAHKVMVAAMKCKQDAKPATAEALEKAIYDLYRAYEGKEPNFEHAEKQ